MGHGVEPLAILPFILFCDNNGAMTQFKELRNHHKGKHIERKYYLIHQIVMKGDAIMQNIASMENLTDLFTKTLFTRIFDGHRNNIGVGCIPCIL